MKNNIMLTVGTALLAALPMVGCASTPEPAPAPATTEAKPAEGSCGGDKAAEGSCGGDKAAHDGEKKAGEGSCGEGSCGGAKK